MKFLFFLNSFSIFSVYLFKYDIDGWENIFLHLSEQNFSPSLASKIIPQRGHILCIFSPLLKYSLRGNSF